MQAKGSFTVNRSSSPAHADSGLARMGIDKRFSGDIDAHSLGEMLAYPAARWTVRRATWRWSA